MRRYCNSYFPGLNVSLALFRIVVSICRGSAWSVPALLVSSSMTMLKGICIVLAVTVVSTLASMSILDDEQYSSNIPQLREAINNLFVYYFIKSLHTLLLIFQAHATRSDESQTTTNAF